MIKYISPKPPEGNGDDNNNGSIDKPWATLQRGVDWLREVGSEENVISVEAGEYR